MYYSPSDILKFIEKQFEHQIMIIVDYSPLNTIEIHEFVLI